MVNYVFTDEVITTLLDLFVEMNIFAKIDGRKERNNAVYAQLADALNKHFKYEGDQQLSGKQVNTKWKSLKQYYKEERRKASKSGETFFHQPFLHFLLLL